MTQQSLATTRRALLGVAELVIAGPQYAAHGDIRLRVVPGGLGGLVSGVRVEGGALVWDGGGVALGGTCRELADAVGVTVGAPDVYREGSGVDPDEELSFDPAALALLLGWFERGDAALRTFAPHVERVLWPEHFDVGYALDEVNYGVSPGDATHAAPYAYVGPWTQRKGAFWNASFGAARAAADLLDAEAVVRFFTEGRSAASTGSH
jgi:hypothetical protein